MSQDLTRWKNQNFACSVYNTRYQGGGYLIEAIHVDKPSERAYLRLDTFMGMRGEILKYYIDSSVRILGEHDTIKNTDTQTGFGAGNVVDRIEFVCTPEAFRGRMSKDPNYANWEYEPLPAEEKPVGFKEAEVGKPTAEEEEAQFLAESKKAREEMAKRAEARRQKAQMKKERQQKVLQVIRKMQSLAKDLDASKGQVFRLWKRMVFEWKK